MAYTTIDKPSDYFNTKLYSGTGSELALTGINFQPDLTWIKNRDTTDSHQLVDSVRGATKNLFSNLTNAEATDAQGLKSFDTDGFTVGTRLGMNTSGESYVGWSWLGGGTASSNTDGQLTSSVSVNQDAGFSVLTYTGVGNGLPETARTVGHGLGVTPAVLIIKNRADSTQFNVYHHKNTSAPETEIIYLNLTNATSDDNGFWNDTAPTSSVFTVGGDNGVNGNGDSMVCYAFAEKKGYSKFGSYTGNGNNDGTFIYTGFKPAFVMNKISSGTDNWLISDNKRLGYNEKNQQLFPNLSNAEQTNVRYDLYSNGFKVVNNNGEINTSGATYIYMAFAENPFVTSSGVPTTAR